MTYLDPDVRRILDSFDPSVRDFATLTPAELRANAEQILNDMRPPIDLPNIRDLDVPTRDGSVRARLYQPSPAPTRALMVFFHGGGWELGSLDLSDRALRRLCRDSGVAILSIDYRLAPEHPFPAGLHDCYDATCWAAQNAEVLGSRGDVLVVGGDSAGGNLAAAVAQMARDCSGPTIDHQLLIYPVVTRDFTTPSYGQFEDGYFLTRSAMEHYWTVYAGHERPMYADLLAGRGLQGLPAATIITCSADPLCSEGEEYARLLAEAGVPTMYLSFGGLIHGIWNRDGVSKAAVRFGETLAWLLRGVAED